MTAAVRNRGEWRPATALPVARIAVDVALAHLDRPFDYRVPEHLDAEARPGVRVRVRFAGRLVDGFLLERAAESDHDGQLSWVERVISAEPALTPEIATLCRAVADRYGGIFADVVRFAVPPRHARVEKEQAGPPPDLPVAAVDGAAWARYPRGPAFLTALGEGRAAHAVWQALPGEAWAARIAEAAATTARSGRGALLVVPDQRDVDTLRAECAALLGEAAVVALTAELGPAERYRRWLAVRRGRVRVVVGTRSAAFAPIADPGLLAVWDDGDDQHAEPHAPSPHVRDVLVIRAHQVGAALLVAGFARTAEGQLLVDAGWAREIVADRTTVRAAMPRIVAPADTDAQLARDPLAGAARLPAVAFEAARGALAAGRPVLVQVPRAGYVPWLSCAQCRETARCRHCAGPLGIPRGTDAALPACRWCGRVEAAFRCAACGSRRLRAGTIGSGRTAEELGRAFPGAAVRTSGGGAPVLAAVGARAEIVVATPGAEPRAEAGYGAALLLDGRILLARPDLRVAEETLRRWMNAAAQVVPHGDGGRVVVVADAGEQPVQALVRWDPAGHAAAELAARAEVGFPPAVRMAVAEGAPVALAELLADLPAGVEVLGPVETDTSAEGEPRERGAAARAAIRGPGPGDRAARGAGRPDGAQGRREPAGAAGPGGHRLSGACGANIGAERSLRSEHRR